MLMEDMSRNNCFRRLEYHMFYVLYPFMTYLLTLPRTSSFGLLKRTCFRNSADFLSHNLREQLLIHQVDCIKEEMYKVPLILKKYFIYII
jgi:hypothetical protein